MKLKAEVIQDLGFTEMQVERIKTIAQHPEIIEQGSPTETNHKPISVNQRKSYTSPTQTKHEFFGYPLY